MKSTLSKIYISAVKLCLKEETLGYCCCEQLQALAGDWVAMHMFSEVMTIAQMMPAEWGLI